MYGLPPTVAFGAPIAGVLPLIETEAPNSSPATPSDAVSSVVWAQAEPVSENK